MHGSPAWCASASMISLTRNSVFLQSSIKSSLIYSDVLSHYFLNPFSCIYSGPGTPLSIPTPPTFPLPHPSPNALISAPSRMGIILFSSALLSLTSSHCELRNPELFCDSTVCSVLSLGATLGSPPVSLLYFAADFFLSKYIFMKYKDGRRTKKNHIYKQNYQDLGACSPAGKEKLCST